MGDVEGAYDSKLSMMLTISSGSAVGVGVWKPGLVDVVCAVIGAVIGAVVLVGAVTIDFSNLSILLIICRAQVGGLLVSAQNSETEACHPSITDSTHQSHCLPREGHLQVSWQGVSLLRQMQFTQ